MNIYEELSWRGLVNDISDLEKFNLLMEQGISVYVGVDPTADSMHIGHLLPILVLKRFQMAGYQPVALMGGGTGQIGDPSGRSSERTLLDLETIKDNVLKIRKQVEFILRDDNIYDKQVMIANNADWGNKINMYEFLRDYGKYFNISYMMAKDSVTSRLEGGLSFTEFSYTILQAMDWYIMNQEYGVNVQIGGSDQWGNITSGLELIRKKDPEAICVGLTLPLITKSDGTKFGKTAGGAIWLDAKKTSPYELYQFFLNTADADVIDYLKKFTFLSKSEIEDLEKELAEKPHERAAQKMLAKQMVELLHGEQAYQHALDISKALFSGDIKSLDINEIKASFNGVPSVDYDQDGIDVVNFLVDTKINSSKREAREFINNGSITINGDKITSEDFIISRENAFNKEITIVRKGKKKYYRVNHI